MAGTSFVRTTAPPGVNVLYHTFQGLVVLLAVWRTAVVDWGVWYAPVAWLADLLGLARAVRKLGFGYAARSYSLIRPCSTFLRRTRFEPSSATRGASVSRSGGNCPRL